MRSWRQKKWPYIIVLVLFVAVVSISRASRTIVSEPLPPEVKVEPKKVIVGPFVSIGDTDIPVEVVSSKQAVQKGLSGRLSLGAGSGMLFLFSKADRYGFWMPDMHFPIDIIWINQGKIVDISKNVLNDFDPKNPRFYRPSKPAQYVLEVNAGFTQSRSLKTGDTVEFSGIN